MATFRSVMDSYWWKIDFKDHVPYKGTEESRLNSSVYNPLEFVFSGA